jgi:hypothetical protein
MQLVYQKDHGSSSRLSEENVLQMGRSGANPRHAQREHSPGFVRGTAREAKQVNTIGNSLVLGYDCPRSLLGPVLNVKQPPSLHGEILERRSRSLGTKGNAPGVQPKKHCFR